MQVQYCGEKQNKHCKIMLENFQNTWLRPGMIEPQGASKSPIEKEDEKKQEKRQGNSYAY